MNFNTGRLLDMLRTKRPYNNGEGTGAKEFTEKFIMPVARKYAHFVDSIGNVIIDLRGEDKHRTLFTAHTDSVHRSEGTQELAAIEGPNKEKLIITTNGECLGADDAAGVAVMLHMIEAGVAGAYAFFVGEEVGCVGSKFFVQEHADFLEEFDHAIAFDRRSTTSIITHQMNGRGCSDVFAEALAGELSGDVLMFMPDDTGIYTDTAHFTHIIPECTNVSVGYMNEHTEREYLDLQHVKDLSEQLVKVDFSLLPVERDPSVQEFDYMRTDYAGSTWAGFDNVNEDLVIWEEGIDTLLEIRKGINAYSKGDTERLHESLAALAESMYGVDYELVVDGLNRLGIDADEMVRVRLYAHAEDSIEYPWAALEDILMELDLC